MGDELPSNVTVDGAYDGALCCVLNFESGASPELYEGEDAQISDATCETALLHDKSLLSSGTFPSACSTPDNAQYWEPVFRADVSQGGKGFQLFQLCRRYEQRRFGCFSAEYAAVFEPDNAISGAGPSHPSWARPFRSRSQ